MQLISYCEPRQVMLVHGEAQKMEFLRQKIRQEHGIDCFMPANGETAKIPVKVTIPATVSSTLIQEEAARCESMQYVRIFCGLLTSALNSDQLIGDCSL